LNWEPDGEWKGSGEDRIDDEEEEILREAARRYEELVKVIGLTHQEVMVQARRAIGRK
jgi:hypothetical protein